MKNLTEYLVPASKNIVLECGQAVDESRGKELEDLVVVWLSGRYLKNVEHLQYCYSLKICILANNFITNIDSLACCPHLVELDLHGNQIEHLPGAEFWEGLRELAVLYLHGTGLGDPGAVRALGACRSLAALTAFDTPLSLRAAYRRCAARAIRTLRALDYYVVSDEEVVEGWTLPEKYRPLCPSLFLDFSPLARKEGNAEKALSRVKDVIAKINRVLAHHSPIIIVQRWIRGYLTRKRLGRTPSRDVPLQMCYRDEQVYAQSACSVCGSDSLVYPVVKPGRSSRDEKRSSGRQKRTTSLLFAEDIGKPITVDLAKLQERATKVFNMNDSKELPGLCLGGERQPITSALDILWREVAKINVKQEGSLWRKGPLETEHTGMEMQTEMKFSPPTSSKPSHAADQLTPLQDKRGPGCDPQQKGPHGRCAPGTSHLPAGLEKSAPARGHQSMTFDPFYLIDKFYSENRERDSQAQKLHKVVQMRIAKDKGGQYIQKFLEEKQRSIQEKCEEEGLRIARALQQHEKKRAEFIENVRQRHTTFLESKKQRALEYSVGQDFNAQHTALTQGLLKLDRRRKLDDGVKERQRIVEESREQMRKCKQLIKNFQDQRQLRIQTENLAEKTIMSSVVAQKTNERLEEAKANVARAKERRAKAGASSGAPWPLLPAQAASPCGLRREAVTEWAAGRVQTESWCGLG